MGTLQRGTKKIQESACTRLGFGYTVSMNTNQGEAAMIRADDREDVMIETPADAWEDIPGVPLPTDAELEEMARYFGEA